MILVDVNVPMYLVGADHPNKARAQAALTSAIVQGELLVTDAEILQEILHRYRAQRRPEAISICIRALLRAVHQVFPIEGLDVIAAGALLERFDELTARDAVHVAIMQRYAITQIMTFDSDFDSIPGIHRIGG